jgi:hypothetical protein
LDTGEAPSPPKRRSSTSKHESYSLLCGSWPYLPSWTRLRIQIYNSRPIRLRIRNTDKKVESIHLNRIVALAEPPQTGTGKGQWLSPEILSMFLFHHMRSLSHQVIIVFIIIHLAWIQIQTRDFDKLFNELLKVSKRKFL